MEDILALLDGPQKYPAAALVIRHAERPAIKTHDGYRMTGLTERGKRDALRFGTAISNLSDRFTFFHSPVKRCLQTAELMHTAVLNAGRESVFRGPEETLGVSYMLADLDTGFSYSDILGDDFIRTWFGGRLEPGIFMPLAETVREHIEYIRARTEAHPGLGVHVTHDWNIAAMREGIFGLRHEDNGWPGYLSGMLFTLGPEGLQAHVLDGDGKKITSAILP